MGMVIHKKFFLENFLQRNKVNFPDYSILLCVYVCIYNGLGCIIDWETLVGYNFDEFATKTCLAN